MFERTVRVRLSDLAAGMVVKSGRAWVRINHIDPMVLGSSQRKGTCTSRRQRRHGAFTVWFETTMHKVLVNSLPPDYAIMPVARIQARVHNTANGEVNGPLIQTGSIDGQTVTDFFKGK